MGWWLALEVDIELPAGSLVRPDLAGWRRERGAPDRNERPCRPVPDWICEIVSPSNRRHDLVTKVRLYAQARITHYWLLDPDDGTLTVYRLTPEGYLVALTATEHETVRPEPFDALDVSVAVLLGID